MLTRLVSCRLISVLPSAIPVLVNKISDVAISLTDTPLLSFSETEARQFDVREGDLYFFPSLPAEEIAVPDIFFEIIPNDPFDNLPEALCIPFDSHFSTQRLLTY